MGSKEGHSDGGAVADGDLHRRRPSKFAERKQIYKRIKRARVVLVICVPKRGTTEKHGFQGGGGVSGNGVPRRGTRRTREVRVQSAYQALSD